MTKKRQIRQFLGAAADGGVPTLDFSAPDRADPDKLNALLWHAMKPGIPMPPPVRSAVLMGR